MDDNQNPIPENQPVFRPTSRPVYRRRRKQNGSDISATLQTVFSVALVMATLFTMWNPANLFSNQMLEQAFLAWQSNATPVASSGDQNAGVSTNIKRIGIISGHYSKDPPYDTGAVCTDGSGIKEVDVNYKVAYLVYQNLKADGYQVDLLQEFDPLITNYKGLLLLSIHSDTCEYIDNTFTGFKVAPSSVEQDAADSQRLANCLIARYATDTNLPYNANTISNDMRFYHAFNEIAPTTPAAIIETGFLNLDRDILVNHPDVVAKGITDGILCFINNETILQTTPTP
ncbi:MAG TPA: N-acetylmuramoyl-L-alanine amidase [Longilinea sp.]|nr:N-acetylmuramoyl-L-alanine amidase [Longilinea sp.]